MTYEYPRWSIGADCHHMVTIDETASVHLSAEDKVECGIDGIGTLKVAIGEPE